MKKILLSIFALFISTLAFSEVFRISQPFIYNGAVYDVIMNVIQKSDSNKEVLNNQKIAISLHFYSLCDDKTGTGDVVANGGFNCFKCDYSSVEYRDKLELVKTSTNLPENVANAFFLCNATIKNGKAEITISDVAGSKNMKLSFYKPSSSFAGLQGFDIIPQNYTDDESANYLHSVASADKSFKEHSGNVVNYIAEYAGDIDSKEFPMSPALRQTLEQNEDFVFKMSMDLYLDILRFRNDMFSYDEEKLKTFLLTHDVRYFQYQSNPEVLKTKMESCIALLKDCCKKINLGSIFYKDYKLNANQAATTSNLYSLISMEDADEYYGAKKIKGERDAFYKINALSIYISNWAALRGLNLNEIEMKNFFDSMTNKSKPVTLRLYFLVQPFSAFSDDGNFKGVTAYGLKAILYNGCVREPLIAADNVYLNNISDAVVKRCYVSGVKFINNYLGKQDWITSTNVAALYEDKYADLGNWQQSYGDCQTGYNYLSAQIKKLPTKEHIISLRLLTNYNATLQPGYEIVFSNRTTGDSYKLPVQTASLTMTGQKGGYYNLLVKVPAAVYGKMLISLVDNISVQCAGEPVYSIPHAYFYKNPNEVIKEEVKNIQLSFTGDYSHKLTDLLKQGL